MSDEAGLSSVAQIQVSINAAPTAVNDDYTTLEDTTLTGNVITNPNGTDSDPAGEPVTLTEFSVDTNGNGSPATFLAGETASLTNALGNPIGSLTVESTGDFTFVPATNYNGPVPVVTYTITDPNGNTDPSTLEITITPVNDAPVARDDSANTGFDTPISFAPLANDTDVDGDTLTILSLIHI